MGKELGTSQDLDNLNMLNLGDETGAVDENPVAGGTLDGIDLGVTEEPSTSEDSNTPAAPEATVESGTDTAQPTTAEGDKVVEEDFDKMIQELINSGSELEGKAQEVSEAIGTENPEAQQLIGELQSMLSEKNVTIEQLTKDADIWKSKYMERYSEDVDLSIYKPEIEAIESNGKLRALVKYWSNPNTKVSDKVTKILSDLFYERTGQDISELLDEKDRAATASVLNTASIESPLTPTQAEEKPEEISRDDAMNSIIM